MFNFFSNSMVPVNIEDKNSNVYPTWTWSTGIKDADGKDISVENLILKYNTLLNENKILREELESIEEDGTKEHNNAIKLREENAQLKIDLENSKDCATAWRIHYDQAVDRHTKLEDEILEYKKGNKNWMNLYQEVVDKNNALLRDIKLCEAKHQIILNDYKKCTEQRDEFKHQLDAANKEIEALKKEKKDSFEILKRAIEDESDRSDKLASTYTNTWINLETANKEIEQLKRWKKEQLTVQSWWDKIDAYVRDHQEAPLGGIVANTCLRFLKERDEYKAEVEKLKKDIIDYVYEKDEQKHPMYPIHWGGYDGAASAHPEEYKKWLYEQGDKAEKEVEFDAEELLRRTTEFAESLAKEPSWEQTASDLALRVAKLEKMVEELKLIKYYA